MNITSSPGDNGQIPERDKPASWQPCTFKTVTIDIAIDSIWKCMIKVIKKHAAGLSLALVLLLLDTAAHAYDVSDKFSAGGLLAGAIQCQHLSNAEGFSNSCEAAAPFQAEFSFRPTDNNEVFFKLGFAAGNGINGNSPFIIPPWAADLEDDVKNINGRNRDYLLTAWYRHTFQIAQDHQLGASFGIIDATDYLDENVYANDEYTQFMNPALTNGPNVFLPSYDMGVALQWDNSSWSLRGVAMNIGENEDGNNYSFYGLQAGYSVINTLGAGNYRFVIAGASEDFLDPNGTQLEDRSGALLSFDQELGNIIGGWLRFGWQTDDAAVEYRAIYSGGLDFNGNAWGRADDNVGLGYAWLDGGSLDVKQSQVAEAYYRFDASAQVAMTANIQYQQDDYDNGPDPRGFTAGIRLVAEF
jgi:hypothetical protein